MQLAVVILLLAVAVAYAAWRVVGVVRHADDPCAGCPGCAQRGQIRENEACVKKKTEKNLAEPKK